jgi:hypothetical protein
LNCSSLNAETACKTLLFAQAVVFVEQLNVIFSHGGGGWPILSFGGILPGSVLIFRPSHVHPRRQTRRDYRIWQCGLGLCLASRRAALRTNTSWKPDKRRM